MSSLYRLNLFFHNVQRHLFLKSTSFNFYKKNIRVIKDSNVFFFIFLDLHLQISWNLSIYLIWHLFCAVFVNKWLSLISLFLLHKEVCIDFNFIYYFFLFLSLQKLSFHLISRIYGRFCTCCNIILSLKVTHLLHLKLIFAQSIQNRNTKFLFILLLMK